MSKSLLPSNRKYFRMLNKFKINKASFFFKDYINDIESLIKVSDDEIVAQIDDILLNETSSNDQQMIKK